MAFYLHMTTTTSKITQKIPSGWFLDIQGGIARLPDGTEIEAACILSTLIESKRETPARDAKLAAIERAKTELAEAQAFLGIPVGTLHSELEGYVEAAVTLTKAQDALIDHDLALARAKESAKKARENPKPKAEPKVGAKPKAKKAPKK